MMPENPLNPLNARTVDLDVLADSLVRDLGHEPGLVRLEPTIRSVIKKFKIPSLLPAQQRPLQETGTTSRDGLVLTLVEGVVNVQADIATDVEHRALGIAESIQHRIADSIRRSGLTAGEIDITILAIESHHSTPS